MAKFDFVEAAAAGYRFVWAERRNIAPFATIPLLVKIGCYAAVAFWGLEDNYLRQGLLLLPGYFMEGFVVAIVIRMALFGENYNRLFEMAQDKAVVPDHISRSILACVAIYLLTKLVSSFFAGIVMNAMPELKGISTVTSLMILVFAFWAFRFFWLYVPAAMDISIPNFIHKIRGFMTSFYLAGFWMVCCVPFLILLLGFVKIMAIVFPEGGGVVSIVANIIGMAVAHSFVELLIALISAVGMGYAVRSMMNGPKPPSRLF